MANHFTSDVLITSSDDGVKLLSTLSVGHFIRPLAKFRAVGPALPPHGREYATAADCVADLQAMGLRLTPKAL